MFDTGNEPLGGWEDLFKRLPAAPPVGWVCPLCRRANAPDVKQCPCTAPSTARYVRTMFPWKVPLNPRSIIRLGGA